jgi:glycosyltransferase involved in cell wall biosynthesis
MRSICLNMIVKNESSVIRRCLSSIRSVIDYWVIVDTGSSDGTQEMILESMKGIPGKIHEQKWINFEHNRNCALELARNRCDYILCVDADDTMEFSLSFDKASLERDCYLIRCRDPVVDSYRILMINNDPGWKWVGILHEELQIAHPVSGQILSGVMKNGLSRDGYRMQDPKCYLNDALILEKEHQKDPFNCRTVFYLAQSYLTARESKLALKYYELRSSMGGYEEEVFWSLYMIGCLQEDLMMEAETIIDSYWKAYEFDRSRAEPLYSLSRFFLKIGNPAMGYLAGRAAISIPYPKSLFMVQRDVYEYGALLFFSYCQHMMERFDEAQVSYRQLLAKDILPREDRKTVEQFLTRCQRKQSIRVATDYSVRP